MSGSTAVVTRWTFGNAYATLWTPTRTHTHLTALVPGLSGWAGIIKVKPIWILLKQETVSGSGISWAICKSAPRSLHHTHPFNGTLSGTTRMSRYRLKQDSEWQWNLLGHNMQVCTSLQTDNHASTPPLRFLQTGCPSCHPTNSVKALKKVAPYTINNYQNAIICLAW